MIRSDDTTDRHLVPRWLTLPQTVATGELVLPAMARDASGIAATRLAFNDQFDGKVSEWIFEKSIAAAEELVAAAVVLGIRSAQVLEAAQHVIDDAQTLSGSRQMAFNVLFPKETTGNPPYSDERAIYALIRKNRASLAFGPRDSLLLIETARLMVMVGSIHSAQTLIKRALALTPSNRYVFRSAIRFYVHTGYPDEAVDLAERHTFVAEDPWLLAAAFGAADAAGRDPFYFKQAKHLLAGNRFRPYDLSELAGSLATIHMTDGSHRLARKLFRQSLQSPTENAVAQIEWAHRRDSSISFSTEILKTKNAFEAKAREAQSMRRWNESMDAAEQWAELEPFNPAPFIQTTCIAAGVTGDLPRARAAGDRGLMANPQNPSLLNNMAVTQAYMGNIENAEYFLLEARKHSKGIQNSSTMTATAGLIAFRRGDPVTGTRLYGESLSDTFWSKTLDQRLRVSGYLARELVPFDPKLALQVVDKMDNLSKSMEAKKLTIPSDVAVFIEDVRNRIVTSEHPPILNSARLMLAPMLDSFLTE